MMNAEVRNREREREGRLEQKEAEIAKLKRSNATLEQRLTSLERIVGHQEPELKGN